MTAPRPALSAVEARAVLARLDEEALVGLLAYAEALAVPLAGLGVHLGAPGDVVEVAIDETITGRVAWTPHLASVEGHVRALIRSRASAALLEEAQQRGRTRQPWAARLADVQIGDLRGLELVFHYGAEMAVAFRRHDPAVRMLAADLAAGLQRRLAYAERDTRAPDARDLTLAAGPARKAN
jgi:hypothetical protein